MAVVKANAYGHGAAIISTLIADRVDAFAVASLEEAQELRQCGIKQPILLLEGLFHREELASAVALDLWLTIANEQQLQWLEAATVVQHVTCWLKVNTGMNRLGVTPASAGDFTKRIAACTNINPAVVVYTHFASADNLASDMTQRQLTAFEQIDVPGARSAANSAGVMAWPQSHCDWIRPGYMLYGNSPFTDPQPAAANLQPVMTFRSAVIAITDVPAGESVGYGGSFVASQPSRIATVAVGYGDGYPRSAMNRTPVIVNGQRATLAGRVSMDMITVDVTGLKNVELGSEVILWGPQLPVNEVAAYAGTLGYELTTRMPPRAHRVLQPD
jgi:alanine racemase